MRGFAVASLVLSLASLGVPTLASAQAPGPVTMGPQGAPNPGPVQGPEAELPPAALPPLPAQPSAAPAPPPAAAQPAALPPQGAAPPPSYRTLPDPHSSYPVYVYPPPPGYAPAYVMAPPPPPRRLWQRRSEGAMVGGGLLIGLGGLGMVVGTALLAASPPPMRCYGGCYEPAPDSAGAGVAVLTVGLVAVGVGIPLLVWGAKRVPARTAWETAFPAPGGDRASTGMSTVH